MYLFVLVKHKSYIVAFEKKARHRQSAAQQRPSDSLMGAGAGLCICDSCSRASPHAAAEPGGPCSFSMGHFLTRGDGPSSPAVGVGLPGMGA